MLMTPLETRSEPERVEHAQRIGARRIGQHELAPAQAAQRRTVVGAAAQAGLELGQAMRVIEEVRRVDGVVADQAEQRRAVAPPVALAQRGRGVVGEFEMLGDVVASSRR